MRLRSVADVARLAPRELDLVRDHERAPEADGRGGQPDEQSAPRDSLLEHVLPERRERLVLVYLDDEAPRGVRDPPQGGEHLRAAIVDEGAEAFLFRERRAGGQTGALEWKPERERRIRAEAQGREKENVRSVFPDEQGLAGRGRHRLPEKIEEKRRGVAHGEDRSEERRVGKEGRS